MSADLTLYSPTPSPRLDYALREVLGSRLGLSWQLLHDKEEFRQLPTPKLVYDFQPWERGELFLQSVPLLFERGIAALNPENVLYEGYTYSFKTLDASSILPFDPLAFAFYQLSRYEEYLPHETDQHGRFIPTQSWAYRAGMLRQPMVERAADVLLQVLLRFFPELPVLKRSFGIKPTYDIDIAYTYLHRPLWILVGSTLRDVLRRDFKALATRLAVWRRKQPDPFDTFAQIKALHQSLGQRPTIFFLLGEYGRYDKNLNRRGKAMKNLILEVATWADVGIHPSYGSWNDVEKMRREQNLLAQHAGQQIERSRQHFLKLKLPETYRLLLELGIKEDYTMGYAQEIGFRAGSSLPFFWYDLEKEAISPLLLFSFAYMDVTMKQYHRLSAKLSSEWVRELHQNTSATGGYLCSLFHNSSFHTSQGWEGWWASYERWMRQFSDI